jgi:hypothetical protein
VAVDLERWVDPSAMVDAPHSAGPLLGGGGAQAKAAVVGISPPVERMEADSSLAAGSVPAMSLGGLHELDDSLEADT